MSVRVPRLGSLLEPSWGPLGPSWRPLGPSWGPLGLFWGSLGGLLGYVGAIFGASWAVVERREAEKARTPKSFKNLRKINDLCLLGPSGECFWRPLGASWKRLGPSGGYFGVLDRSFCDSGPSRTVLGASWGTLAPSWGFSGPQDPPGGCVSGWRPPPGGSGAQRSPKTRQECPKRLPRRSSRAPNRRAIGPRRQSSLQTAEEVSKTLQEASKSTTKRAPRGNKFRFSLSV